MAKGTQRKIGKVRPPRVQITYDVELGDAVKQKSLPFVMGVVADLGAGKHGPAARLRERAFVEIDGDNFDKAMGAIAPALALSVPNKLGGDRAHLKVDLAFRKLDDFSPAGVAGAVPELAQLLETRAKLNDLLAKLEGNERLNDLLAEVVQHTQAGQPEPAGAERASKPDPLGD